MAQYVEIDSLGFSFAFFCPACGKSVCDAQGEDTGDPCEHLLFTYNSEGGFGYVSPEMEFLNDEDDDDLTGGVSLDNPEFLARCPEYSVLFAFQECDSPASPTTVVYCIRFPSCEDE